MLSVFVVTLPIVPRTASLVIPCPKFSAEGTSALAISSVCQEFVIWFNLVRNQVNMLCLLLACGRCQTRKQHGGHAVCSRVEKRTNNNKRQIANSILLSPASCSKFLQTSNVVWTTEIYSFHSTKMSLEILYFRVFTDVCDPKALLRHKDA